MNCPSNAVYGGGMTEVLEGGGGGGKVQDVFQGCLVESRPVEILLDTGSARTLV